MIILPDFHNTFVLQRDPKTGCIPTGIEWILRYLKIEGINFDDFQEKYDLKEENSFGNIPQFVMKDYPQISFVSKSFLKGKEKIDFIRNAIEKGIPVLISITLRAIGGWHIVPAVEIDEEKMIVLWMIEDSIEKQKKEFLLSDIEFRHDNWPGGQDILYWNK